MALWLAAVAAIALGGPYLLQDRLLYFPQRASVAEVAQGGLAAWPSADDFRGLVAPPQGAARATAIVFHGNAGHAGHRAYYAAALAPPGRARDPGRVPRLRPARRRGRRRPDGRRCGTQHRTGAPAVRRAAAAWSASRWAPASPPPRRRASRRRWPALLLITPWDRLEHVAATTTPGCRWAGCCATATTASRTWPASSGRCWWWWPSTTTSCRRSSARRCTTRCAGRAAAGAARGGPQRLADAGRCGVVAAGPSTFCSARRRGPETCSLAHRPESP